ncbi:SHOCT domain-containing protein [Allostreptomyces psammosilenae]|uniref:Putative membrane protein n=1 Tax=Allostreptomyces psammosilenae TaxID=1892865 RepID=A0A853A9H5_9ACTN|nr:SHOCT domain-containing protein [Allostreptomyces psammosilenae]NYI07271.1 putative membrane protein [Allostreptomyces psammosilenae]
MYEHLLLAYDYPVLGAFWTVMWVFLWVMWLFLLFRVVTDVFRDHSLGGWAKAGWLVFLILIPFLGALVYVIARGREMGRRENERAQQQLEAVHSYFRQTAAEAGGTSEAEQLTRLSELKARGDISETEFARAKEKILH